jgi:ferredoxin--NADP+ reductase
MVTDIPKLRGIRDDHREQSQIEAFLRQRGLDYVTYEDWRILDAYEVARGAGQSRPRVKLTTVPEMMEIIQQGRS